MIRERERERGEEEEEKAKYFNKVLQNRSFKTFLSSIFIEE